MKKRILFIALFFLIITEFLIIAKDNYKLQSGDVLKIFVWKHPEFDRTVKVNIDGDIIYDVIGKNIKAKDLTIKDLAKLIEKELSSIIYEPKIVIDIAEFQKNNIIILGEEIKEGLYNLEKNTTLIEMLKQVGWSYNKDKITNVKIIKQNGGIKEIKANEIIELGKSENNITFENGDIVYISIKPAVLKLEKKIKVLITGEVKNQKIYDFDEKTKLITALQSAGWEYNKTRNQKVTILREKDKKKIEMYISDIFEGKIEKNILLENDDIIYISDEKEEGQSETAPQMIPKSAPAVTAQSPKIKKDIFEPPAPSKIHIFLIGSGLSVQGRIEVKDNFNILDLLELIKWKPEETYYTNLEITNQGQKKIISNLEKTILINSDILKYPLSDNDVIMIEKKSLNVKINLFVISDQFKTEKYIFNPDITLTDFLNAINYQYSDSYFTTFSLYRDGNPEISFVLEENIDKLSSRLLFANNDVIYIERYNRYKEVSLVGDSIKENLYKLESKEKLMDLLKKSDFKLQDDVIQIAYIKRKNGENKVIILNDLLNLNKQEYNLNLNDRDYIQIKDYVEINYDNSIMQVPKNDALTFEFKLHNIDAAQIVDNLKNYTEGKNSIIVNSSKNSIIIKDTPLNIKKLIPVIMNLDKPLQIKQFRISAQIVEVSMSNEDEYNLSFGEQSENYSNGTTNTIRNENLNINTLSYNLEGQIIFRSYPSNMYVMLNDLKKKGKVNTLSRPKIVTLNKKEAEISVGNQIPYRKSETNNINGLEATNVAYEFKDVYIKLKVTPEFVYPDKIMLNIQPEANSLAGYTIDNQPIINSRKASTNIIIKSGDTVFIGGIISTSNTESEQKNKLLDKIPLLNNLFGGHKKTDSRNELIVLLTCEVIE